MDVTEIGGGVPDAGDALQQLRQGTRVMTQRFLHRSGH